MIRFLRIATRKSPLALWQAHHVAACLQAIYPALETHLVQKVTRGDKIVDAPLAKLGGKGLFVKELEESLFEGSADIAVHSMKDVPADIPEGLHFAAILAREDPRDAFVSERYKGVASLPEGSRIGTSSLRRQCQLKMRFPHYNLVSLRGNVGTRLDKLALREYDAIILAAAGLKRLGLEDRITEYLSPGDSVPAVGQGAMGVQCRCDCIEITQLVSKLNDPITATCISAERAFNHRLNGGCQAPIAAHAEWVDRQLHLSGLVGRIDGSSVLRGTLEGPDTEATELGIRLADSLLDQGADSFLRELYE